MPHRPRGQVLLLKKNDKRPAQRERPSQPSANDASPNHDDVTIMWWLSRRSRQLGVQGGGGKPLEAPDKPQGTIGEGLPRNSDLSLGSPFHMSARHCRPCRARGGRAARLCRGTPRPPVSVTIAKKTRRMRMMSSVSDTSSLCHDSSHASTTSAGTAMSQRAWVPKHISQAGSRLEVSKTSNSVRKAPPGGASKNELGCSSLTTRAPLRSPSPSQSVRSTRSAHDAGARSPSHKQRQLGDPKGL